jgi:transcriptional regulator with GAF, ATPase, and Fis domain
MERTITNRTRLAELQRNLKRMGRSWSSREYEELIRLFVRLLPGTLGAERCGIFIVEPGTERIVIKAGTGVGEGDIVAPPGDSVVGRVIRDGRPAIENDLAGREGFHRELAPRTGFLTHSVVCVPVLRPADGVVIGAIEVLNRAGGGPFGAADRELLEKVADLLAQGVENARLNREMVAVSRQLERELTTRAFLFEEDDFVAQSPPMRALVERARVVAELPVNVLILGENGTGKERIARLIHELSDRSDQPFVAENCASVPESLVESEFFGYEKGAFTGASQGRGGRFEEADKGTLFLDEVGDLPAAVQPKLLRVLQEGEGRRLGSGQVRRYDFRVICATNRDLKALVAEGRFREDLYYRLFSVEITIPPLRERGEDLAAMVQSFLKVTCRRFGKPIAGLAPEVMALLQVYDWPGNVRQLRNEIERLVAFTPARTLAQVSSCSPELLASWRSPGAVCGPAPDGAGTLQERVQGLERELIREALQRSGGNRERAAQALGLSRQGLYNKLVRYGLG